MNLHESHFRHFLWHNEAVDLNSLQTAPSPLQDSYVVLAHVLRVVSTNFSGVTLGVCDHTGTAVFNLRGLAAGDFYDEHIRRPDHPEPITDPFALNGTWFETYLFRINTTTRVTVNGEDSFVVSQICMHRDTIDQFCLYVMEEEAYRSYQRAIAVAVPSGLGYGSNDIDISPNRN